MNTDSELQNFKTKKKPSYFNDFEMYYPALTGNNVISKLIVYSHDLSSDIDQLS